MRAFEREKNRTDLESTAVLILKQVRCDSRPELPFESCVTQTVGRGVL
jgi:hypothetical protein